MVKHIVEGFVPVSARVMEMDAGTGVSDVPLDAKLVEALIDNNKDEDPMFVTLEVLNEGVSKNKKNYTKEFILDVAEQINRKKVDGYLGHLTAEEMATKTPEAQTVWLGAVAKEVNGKTRLFAKAYVLPYAKKLRTYLRTAKATGKKVSVSINGFADKAIKNTAGAFDLHGFSLDSIDWARPGAEGVPTSGQFVLASEMRNNSPIEETEMDRVEVIKDLKVSEIKEHNPELVSEMVDGEVNKKKKELETAKVAVQEMTDVRKALGVDEKAELPKVVQEMVQRNLERDMDSELASKVKNPEARKVIRTLVEPKLGIGVQVSEMVDEVLDTDEAKAVVREMTDRLPTITPSIDKPLGTQHRKYTKVK